MIFKSFFQLLPLSFSIYQLSSNAFYFHSISITIIMYHHIIFSGDCSNLFFISISNNFTDQNGATDKDYHGYQMIVLRQDLKACYTQSGLPPLQVVTTGPHTWNIARFKNSTFLFVQHHFIATSIYLANSCQNHLRHHFPHDDFHSLIHKTPCCFPQGLAFQDPLQDEYIIFYYEHLFDTTLYSTRQNFLISQFRLLTGS